MKIQFEQIRFKNFLSYGNNITEFQFKNGLQLISGQNGTGKSSFALDVLSFNLYGRPYRDIKISELINNKNESKLWTECSFKKDNSVYRIERGLKPDLLKIFKDDKELDLLSHKSLIQEEIDKILGINHSLFKQIISLSILNNKPFLTLPKADKTNILESIFNIKVFGKMLKTLKKNYTELKSSFELSNKELELYKSNLETFVAHIKAIQTAKSEFDSKKEKGILEFEAKFKEGQFKMGLIMSAMELIDLDKLKVNSLNKDAINMEMDRIKSKVAVSNDKLKKLVDELSFLENPENDNNDFVERYEDKIKPLIKDILEGTKTIASEILDFKLTCKDEWRIKHDEIVANVTECENKIKVLNKEKTFLTRDYLEKNLEEVLTLNKRLSEIKIQANNLKDDINKLEDGKGVCDYCKQDIDSDHQIKEIKSRKDLIVSLLGERDSIQNKIQELILAHIKERNQNIDSDILKLNNEIESLKKQDTIGFEKLQKIIHDKMEDFVKRDEGLTLKKNQIISQKLSGIKENLKVDIQTERDFKKTQDEILNNLKIQLKEIEAGETLFQEKKNELEKMIIQKDNLIDSMADIRDQLRKLKEDEFNYDIEKLKTEFEEKKSIYKEMKSKNVVFKNKIKVCEVIKDDVLDESGIKKFFFSRLIPELNKSINTYLDHFELPVKFEFDSEFDYKIVDFGTERNYLSFSGGERFRIDLSIILSFILLNKLINGCDINILMLDELLDTAVDQDGMELILEKLKELTEKENLCSYIISHKGLENNMYIDNVIKIKKVNGFSHIEV